MEAWLDPLITSFRAQHSPRGSHSGACRQLMRQSEDSALAYGPSSRLGNRTSVAFTGNDLPEFHPHSVPNCWFPLPQLCNPEGITYHKVTGTGSEYHPAAAASAFLYIPPGKEPKGKLRSHLVPQSRESLGGSPEMSQ